MKVLLYADFRSSHARGWHEGLLSAGLEVVPVSSEIVIDYEADSPSDRVSRRRQLFVESRGHGANRTTGKPGFSRLPRRMLSRIFNSQTFHSLVHLARSRYLRARLQQICDLEQPDLIHALRIPYEGVTALSIATAVPRVVSTWGSDIVPQSSSDPILGQWTRSVLRRIDGFQFDSSQDLARAEHRGLRAGIPTLHAAGNFGVENQLFYVDRTRRPGIVVYPRRAKPNANYRGFVEAAVRLSQQLDAKFIGVGLESARDELTEVFGESSMESVELTGQLSRGQMAELIRSAEVVVSPTYWDGTPISVLEAIASGAKVIAGSLPELVALKAGGMDVQLIDATSTDAIAESIASALSSEGFGNAGSLPIQFDRVANQGRVIDFYEAIMKERPPI